MVSSWRKQAFGSSFRKKTLLWYTNCKSQNLHYPKMYSHTRPGLADQIQTTLASTVPFLVHFEQVDGSVVQYHLECPTNHLVQ
jgi:hypothetical protein